MNDGLLFDPPKMCETLDEYIEALKHMQDEILKKKEEQKEDVD